MCAAPAWAQGARGSLAGQVYDRETGKALAGAKVVVSGAAPAEQVTGADGNFTIDALPAGTYAVTASAPDHRDATLSGVTVKAGEKQRADVALPPLPKPAPAPAADGATPGEAGTAAKTPPPLDIEEFVVTGSTIAMDSLALRISSDELLNVLSAEDLSKFAASDVADAAKRVAGVNVVEGQFAIIRGLEDRYSSTLFNGAVIPSPDPDTQSVQLDLFPSDVVSNLVVSKTFGADMPSNSSGGSIDIITNQYPEEPEIKLSAGTGFETYAADRFLRFDDGSPTGYETDFWDILESDFSLAVGGPWELLGRGMRFKGNLSRELDYRTAEGFQETRQPRPAERSSRRPYAITRAGDLSLGNLGLSGGRFDLTESERAKQFTGFGGLGLDLDEGGNHKIDLSLFYTDKEEETVQLTENGWFPNFDYSALAARQADGSDILSQNFNGYATIGSWLRSVRPTPQDTADRGPLWSASYLGSESFDTSRDLLVYQINGDHHVEALDGLHVRWAANHARTTQDETALGMRFFYEPDDPTQIPTSFPVTVGALGAGRYAVNDRILYSANQIDEHQNFGRIDAEYERDLADFVTVKVSSGGWLERADRDVASSFLESPTLQGSSQFALFGDTPQDLGQDLLGKLDSNGDDPSGLRDTTNQASRSITAWNLGAKATLFENLDLLGGMRHENIVIESKNEAFTGQQRFGAPATFPETYLFFDRLDNPYRAGERLPRPGEVYNDQLLGIDVPLGPCRDASGDVPRPELRCVDLLDRGQIGALVNGRIDEHYFLPSAGIAWRPLPGLSLRGAYSRTVARPSFREIGFYVTVEPASDDLVVGNPQLGLSNVESYDTRAEYSWGDLGDLVAVSGFVKNISHPIESIVIRNPLNAEASSSALYRTFFNNPNEASLWGLEFEAHKNLGFLGPAFLEYFSIGGNFTWIHAEVDRTEAELARSQAFFGAPAGVDTNYSGIETSRRLFNQPEWIANAEISFDQPDWGTKATLAYFAISSVLDAAGSAFIGPDGRALDFTLDRYVDSFHQLDLIVEQKIWDGLVAKLSVKNLTNSTRQIVYDPLQTHDEISERSLKVGRDISFSLTYTHTF